MLLLEALEGQFALRIGVRNHRLQAFQDLADVLASAFELFAFAVGIAHVDDFLLFADVLSEEVSFALRRKFRADLVRPARV